jgi:hypothetical protein
VNPPRPVYSGRFLNDLDSGLFKKLTNRRNMMELSIIEQKLLEREIATFKVEINIGLEIIRKAFDRYMDRSVHSDNKIKANQDIAGEVDAYLKSAKIAGSYYYGGDYLKISSEMANEKSLPDVLKTAMLDVAVAEFLAQVDSIKEISGDLQ